MGGVGNSQEVFKLATSKCSVKVDTRVRQVHFVAPGENIEAVMQNNAGLGNDKQIDKKDDWGR